MSDRISEEQKVQFLRQVEERKAKLFNKFAAGKAPVTNEMKQQQWIQIYNWSRKAGLPFCATAGKQQHPCKYIRDKVYGNYVQQLKAISRLDSHCDFQKSTDNWRASRARDRGQSGAAGVIDDVLNAPERVLLDILGRDSVIIIRINTENDDTNPVQWRVA
ncbi:unnamed protein product [Sphagnum balticum]